MQRLCNALSATPLQTGRRSKERQKLRQDVDLTQQDVTRLKAALVAEHDFSVKCQEGLKELRLELKEARVSLSDEIDTLRKMLATQRERGTSLEYDILQLHDFFETDRTRKAEADNLRADGDLYEAEIMKLQEIVRVQHTTLGKCDAELDDMRAARNKDQQERVAQNKEIARLQSLFLDRSHASPCRDEEHWCPGNYVDVVACVPDENCSDRCVGSVCRSYALAKRKARKNTLFWNRSCHLEGQLIPGHYAQCASQKSRVEISMSFGKNNILMEHDSSKRDLCQHRHGASWQPAENQTQWIGRTVELLMPIPCHTRLCENKPFETVTRNDLEEITCNFARCVGAGSFGRVFAGDVEHGRWRDVERHVAIKMPCVLTGQTEAQFLSELRVASFSHPDLMPLAAVCWELRALVYPYAQATLEEYIIGSPHIVPIVGLSLLLGATSGLVALHALRLLHRDVKSSNIFIFIGYDGQDSIAKLCDYGLVCGFSDSNELSYPTLVGTASYLDPMAIVSGCCSWSSDIFSLGVVILETVMCHSVTQIQGKRAQPWCQLNDAMAKDIDSAVADAVAFVRSSGADHGWDASALETITMLVFNATRQKSLEHLEVHRPTATRVLNRLKDCYSLQDAKPLGLAVVSGFTRVCTICFEEEVDARMHPCCHALTCHQCALLLVNRECPLCRTIVDSFEIGRFETTFSPDP